MKQRYAFIITGALLLCLFCVPLFAQSGWSALNSGTSTNLYAVHFINVDNGYVVGAGGTILKTTDGGANWADVSPAGITADLKGIHVFDQPAGAVVAVGNGGLILRSTDGGTSWSPVASGVSDDLLSVSFSFNAGICGGSSQTILNSTNSGVSWNVVQSGLFGGGFWGAHLLSPQIGFVGGENSILQPLSGKTTDGGANWNFTPFYLNGNEGRTYGINFTDEFIGYAASVAWTGHGTISKTTDGGSNWSTMFFTNPLYGINFPVSGASLIGYAVGTTGFILKTYDAGMNWQLQNSSTGATLRDVYFLDFDSGYAVGEGGIILKTTTGGEPPTGIDEGASTPEIPRSLILYQNYPNPFNPITNIGFGISDFGLVRLEVYDLFGKKIVSLLNKELQPGNYQVQWNGLDKLGNQVASGIYLCHLQMGNFVQTRKMVLMR